MQFEVRRANEGDIPAILNLFEDALGTEGGAPVESFWRWKHINNPFGVSPVLLAFDGQKLIGLRAFMRWQWRKNGKVLPALRAVDTATHPDYRGKKIFQQLTLQLIEELKVSEPPCFIFNTPNEQSKPGYLKMGWKVLGKAPVALSLQPFYKKNPQHFFTKCHKDLKCIDFKAVWEDGFRPIHRTGIQRNDGMRFYQWRYIDIPEIPYGCFRFDKNDQACLIFFHLKFRKYFYELRVCDFLVKGNAEKSLFLQTARKLAKQLGTPVISFADGMSLSAGLRLWYLVMRIQRIAPEITIKEVNDSALIDSINTIQNWSFTMGDLELF